MGPAWLKKDLKRPVPSDAINEDCRDARHALPELSVRQPGPDS